MVGRKGSDAGKQAISNMLPIGKVLWDDSSAQATLKKNQQQITDIETKANNTKIKLMQLWTYGNQLASMLLQTMSKAMEGTKAQAFAQTIVAGLQIAQIEVAIAHSILQAQASFIGGQPWIGALQLGIAAAMQSNMIIAQMNKLAAKSAEREIEYVVMLIEAYRS